MIALLVSRFSFAVAPRMGTPADVRSAEVNRLTLQSGCGVWLLLEPRGGGGADAAPAPAQAAA